MIDVEIRNKVSSKNILRRAEKPQGFKALDDLHFRRCKRLVGFGLLRQEPNRVFRRTDKPDNRPGRVEEVPDYLRHGQIGHW